MASALRSVSSKCAWAAAVLAVTAAHLGAQQSNLPPPKTPPSTASSPGGSEGGSEGGAAGGSGGGSGGGGGGWLLTPTIGLSSVWDDNAFLEGSGSNPTSDLVSVVNPQINAEYTGRQSQLSIGYDGAFLLYRNLTGLNSFNQHALVTARRRVARHVSVFATDTLAILPTTQSALLVGVPFVRTGSLVEDLRAGVETELTKRTSFSVAYEFQYIRFDQNPQFPDQLLYGGFSNGVAADLKHQWTSRTSFIADYHIQRANVTATNDVFTVQTAMAGIDQHLSEYVSLVAEGGVSYLQTTLPGLTELGPSFLVGVTRRAHAYDLDVSYGRSFIPSYGFGGTTQNEELLANVAMPLARRVYLHSAAAWRRNEPLTITPAALRLRTLWFESSVGYRFSPSLRIEAFYQGTHQAIDQPGGIINRNIFGVQVEATKPMRIH